MRLYNIISYILYISNPSLQNVYLFSLHGISFHLNQNNVIKCKYIPYKILLCIFTNSSMVFPLLQPKVEFQWVILFLYLLKKNSLFNSTADDDGILQYLGPENLFKARPKAIRRRSTTRIFWHHHSIAILPLNNESCLFSIHYLYRRWMGPPDVHLQTLPCPIHYCSHCILETHCYEALALYSPDSDEPELIEYLLYSILPSITEALLILTASGSRPHSNQQAFQMEWPIVIPQR